MSDLHPTARALIDAAKRRETTLLESTRARVHRSVLRRAATFGTAIATTTSASVAAKAGALTTVLASPLVKAGIVSVFVGVACFVARGFWIAPASTPASALPPQTPPAMTARVPEESSHPVHLSLRTFEDPPEVASALASSSAQSETISRPSRPPPSSSPTHGRHEDAPAALLGVGPTHEPWAMKPHDSPEFPGSTDRPPVGSGDTSTRPGETASTTTDLSTQLKLLHEVHEALGAGQPAQALGLVERNTATLRGSPLAEQAEVARISALCKLGRDSEAHAVIDQFVAVWSRSPLVRRMQIGCPAFRGADVRTNRSADPSGKGDEPGEPSTEEIVK
jgi:hypothetical protein